MAIRYVFSRLEVLNQPAGLWPNLL